MMNKFYIVEVNGNVVLKTESEAKAKRTYNAYFDKNGVKVDSVKLTYPDFLPPNSPGSKVGE